MKLHIKRKYSVAIQKKNLYAYVNAICAVLTMYPYFTWGTFLGGYLKYVGILITVLMGMLLFAMKYNDKSGMLFSKEDLLMLIFIAFYTIRVIVDSTSILRYAPTNIIMGVILFFQLTEDRELMRETYIVFKKIICVLSVFIIVIYLFRLIGLSVPHLILSTEHPGKAECGVYYENYIFGIIMRESSTPNYMRPCGLFDEPGVLGTFLGLLIIPDVIRKKFDKYSILIFLCGAISTSMAFFMIFLFTLLTHAFVYKLKGMIYMALIGIIGINCLPYLLNIPIFSFIGTRLMYAQSTDGILKYFILTRSSENTDIAFNKFSTDIFNLLFGRGEKYLSTIGGAVGQTYKVFIMLYGLITLIVVFLMLYVIMKKNNKSFIGLLIFFIIIVDMYQRVFIFSWSYFLVYTGALILTREDHIHSEISLHPQCQI